MEMLIKNQYLIIDDDSRVTDGKINIFQSYPESPINYINGQQPKISPMGAYY
jgi:hypothetical protein